MATSERSCWLPARGPGDALATALRMASSQSEREVCVAGGYAVPPGTTRAPVHRFAWHCRTLEGHLERGQTDDEVLKHLENGRVKFRIAAYSQRGPIRSPIVRVGFALFGRWTQLRFYARASERMRTLTAQVADRTR